MLTLCNEELHIAMILHDDPGLLIIELFAWERWESNRDKPKLLYVVTSNKVFCCRVQALSRNHHV